MQQAERDQARYHSSSTGMPYAVLQPRGFGRDSGIRTKVGFSALKRQRWAGDMQSKQRTAQRSPITHDSRFNQPLRTAMRGKKKIVDFVDSKVEGQAPIYNLDRFF